MTEPAQVPVTAKNERAGTKNCRWQTRPPGIWWVPDGSIEGIDAPPKYSLNLAADLDPPL